MILQLKTAIDNYVDNDPKAPAGPPFYKFPLGTRKFHRSVRDDLYETAKNIIRDVEMKWRLCFTSAEYEEAIFYICQKLGY
mgnify:CR=1 FL=1